MSLECNGGILIVCRGSPCKGTFSRLYHLVFVLSQLFLILFPKCFIFSLIVSLISSINGIPEIGPKRYSEEHLTTICTMSILQDLIF